MVTLRTYSVGGKTAVNIVSSTNASPIVLTVGSGHGFLAGEPVNVTGHLVNTAANGDWRVRSVAATTITLENARTAANTTGNGVGAATGTIGRKYATLQLAEADTDNNLTAAGTDEQIDLELCMDTASDYSLSSANAAHTFTGATTDSTHYRHIKAAPGHRFNPVDLAGVRIRKQQGNPNGTALVLSEDYLRVTGIGVEVYDNGLTSASANLANVCCVYLTGLDCTIDSVWAKYTGGTGTSYAACFYAATSGSPTTKFRNCIAVGTNDGEFGAAVGFHVDFCYSVSLYNCAAWGTNNAAQGAASYGFLVAQVAPYTTSLANCIAIDCTNGIGTSADFYKSSGTLTSFEYCISGDATAATAPATNGYSGRSASSVWSYAAADDFRNRTTSIGIGAAKPDSSSTLGFSSDFTGVTRGIYWDIGPYSGSVLIDTSAPTDVISTVGSGVGRDYATIDAWMTATDLHLISLNVRHIAELYDDSDFSLGATIQTITGAVTDSRCYRIIRPATGQRYDPITDTGVWITGTGAQTISVSEDYFSIEGVGIGNTSAGGSRVALEFKGKANLADGVYARVLASTGSADAACFYGRTKANQQWRNCIAQGAGAGTAGANYGFRATGVEPLIFNCVAADIDGAGGTSYGFYTSSGLAQVYNCIGSDCDTDFASSTDPLEDYNISTDTSAAGPHSIVSATSVALFVSQANRDFRLLDADSAANNAGYSLSLLFSTDFDGEDRFAPWEIGAYDGFATPPLLSAQPVGSSATLSTLLLVERTDATVQGFTDHNRELTHEGIAYTPGAGFDKSNNRASAAMRASNVELRGTITSDAITDDDLWARRYDGARVTERVVNWRFPWATPTVKSVYYIETIQWTGEEWIANCSAQASRLTQEIGSLMSRDCPYVVGDANCRYDVRLQSEYSQTVTSVPTQRAIFRASGLSSVADEHYRFGKVVWLTGDNAGLESEVLAYTDATRQFEIQDQTPFEIQVGDTFHAIVGCSGLRDDCATKFTNIVNFGGDPYMPGADRMLEGPTA